LNHEAFRKEELETLYRVARSINTSEDLESCFRRVLELLKQGMGLERGMISVLRRDLDEVHLVVGLGLSPDAQVRGRYLLGEGVTGRVAKTGRPMAFYNLDKEPLFLGRTGARRAVDRTELAFICVPIVYEDNVVGVLSTDKLSRLVADLNAEVRFLSAVAELIARKVFTRSVVEENVRLKELLSQTRPLDGNMIGNSKRMKEINVLISQVADSRATVLINGETGTGKELIAETIHNLSSRKDGPFIKVNCAALPDSLIESELFGHTKGAFTGAVSSNAGRFELAEGGTIFLDEVGELSPLAQAKLLRVLQEGEIQRVGSSKTIKVDVRVIAATNQDLMELMEQGRFRSDLYYRLNVFPIMAPPLRERGADILLLADYFAEKYAENMGKSIHRISSSAIDLLTTYRWPGNVRELENCMERAVLLARGDVIEAQHLPPTLQVKTGADYDAPRGELKQLVAAYEMELITDALKASNGNQTKAAESLGTTKRIIQYKISKYNIPYSRFRQEDPSDSAVA